MRRVLSLLSLAVASVAMLSIAGLPPTHAAETYRTYVNARFGTVVEYPANLVIPQPESDNGDGRRFVSKDKLIELTVYASNNAQGRTAKTQMSRALADWKGDGARLTYWKFTEGWYAMSGFIGDDIFYEKALFRKGVFHTVIWQYPKSMKGRLDGVLTRTVQSLRVGQQEVVESGAKAKPTIKTKGKPQLKQKSQTSSGY